MWAQMIRIELPDVAAMAGKQNGYREHCASSRSAPGAAGCSCSPYVVWLLSPVGG